MHLSSEANTTSMAMPSSLPSHRHILRFEHALACTCLLCMHESAWLRRTALHKIPRLTCRLLAEQLKNPLQRNGGINTSDPIPMSEIVPLVRPGPPQIRRGCCACCCSGSAAASSQQPDVDFDDRPCCCNQTACCQCKSFAGCAML